MVDNNIKKEKKLKTKTKKKKQVPKKMQKKVEGSAKKTNAKKVNKKKRKYIVLSISLIVVLGIIAVLILFSDLFNITKITVVNNSKVATEEIVQNSGLTVGNNMFKTLSSSSKNAIKVNPYVEEVKITKKLNGEVIINVTERTATYMLQQENGYSYINNQGYILEETQTPMQLPIIKGYRTKDLTPGNRLEIEDLEKLDTIIEIMESAKSNKIDNIITCIDITDEKNFILEIPSEGKTVQFGDGTNINVKTLWIVDLIAREKGIEGEIILNVTDIKKVYFREKV